MRRKVKITDSIAVGPGAPLLLIAGPCQIESYDHCMAVAAVLAQIAERCRVNLVFKSSYDKANRTSVSSKRGPGIDEGLRILQSVRRDSGIPVLTDVHSPEEASAAGEIVDILQTPAFLCRQTDLLIAAGATGKPVNIKKGQFLSPSDMSHSAAKVSSTGNENILLCERGTCFGYRDLVVDIRGISIMKQIGFPVIFDATHSVQSMGGISGASGGSREFAPLLARASAAAGVDGLFLECHEQPENAPSDGATMLPLDSVEAVVASVAAIRDLVRESSWGAES